MVEASASGVVSSTGYDPQRSWRQKWRDVCDGLAAIQATYGQTALDNEAVRRQVEDFFEDCRELADWLKREAGASRAMDFLHDDKDLRLCDGMAQTTKHHTRDPNRGPDPVTAWISTACGGIDGVSAEIEWSTPSGAGGRVDALDLAQHCTAAWVRFFKQEGLRP